MKNLPGPDDSLAVAVVVRDRFSPFPVCLRALEAHTDLPFHLVIVAGGVDDTTGRYLRAIGRTRSRVSVLLLDRLLTQGESRRWALQAVDEQYCVILENDTLVHRGWLPPLFECMREEEATVVTPLILWHRGVHAAGCDLSVEERNGQVGLVHRINYRDVRRRAIGYPETHCVLVDRGRIGGAALFDDVEPFDVDMGLTLQRQGARSFLEPRSVVTYAAPPPLTVRDLGAFAFRWDKAAWQSRNERFQTKWGLSYDGRAKRASYRRQQMKIALVQRYPTPGAAAVTNQMMGLTNQLSSVLRLRSHRSYT